MKSIKFVLAVLVVVAAVPAFGQFTGSTPADLDVTANVVANCTISTGPVAFGAYDPVVVNSATGADKTANGSITVACTRGIPSLRIDLDNGLLGTREMSDGGTETLAYELYSDAGLTTIWGSGAAGGVDPNASGPVVNPAGKTLTVYGFLGRGQDVAVGNYADTVVATILY